MKKYTYLIVFGLTDDCGYNKGYVGNTVITVPKKIRFAEDILTIKQMIACGRQQWMVRNIVIYNYKLMNTEEVEE